MATKICMRFEGTSVLAELNDTETERAFAQKLPTTIHVSGTGVDFCGRMPFELPYEDSQVGYDWTNGNVNYNPGGGWLAILFDDQENSKHYGDQVNIGRVVGELDVLHALSGSYVLVIERA